VRVNDGSWVVRMGQAKGKRVGFVWNMFPTFKALHRYFSQKSLWYVCRVLYDDAKAFHSTCHVFSKHCKTLQNNRKHTSTCFIKHCIGISVRNEFLTEIAMLLFCFLSVFHLPPSVSTFTGVQLSSALSYHMPPCLRAPTPKSHTSALASYHACIPTLCYSPCIYMYTLLRPMHAFLHFVVPHACFLTLCCAHKCIPTLCCAQCMHSYTLLCHRTLLCPRHAFLHSKTIALYLYPRHAYSRTLLYALCMQS
jgi:hypothetical protein